MPPTDSADITELGNHVGGLHFPEESVHSSDNLSFADTEMESSDANANKKELTKWTVNLNESKCQEPVTLLSYYMYNENGEKMPSSIKSVNALPILNSIHCNLQTPILNCGNVTKIAYDVEKANEKAILPEKLKNGNGLYTPPSSNVSRMSLTNTNSSASLVPCDGGHTEDSSSESKESVCGMTLQVFIPFLIAGFGMVGAGLVLDQVQHWEVFKKISAIYIVVPPLLGLKGNLEMTLASRLSTLANLGSMDSRKSKLTFIGGNMVISQCLASVIGFLTSLLAVLIGSIQDGEFNLNHSLVLIASSVSTAAASSCILDSIMVMVILLSRKYGINPDNVATPIAASLGDITTTGLLAGIGTALFSVIDKITWIGPLVTMMFLILVPLWIYLAWRQPYTTEALKTTCIPVLGAMFISTGGGFILNVAVKMYSDLAVIQPIINGVGGNLVAIQASRIATSLHKSSVLGILPPSHPHIFEWPWRVFCGAGRHVRCAQILMLMVIPGHVIFLLTTSLISTQAVVIPVAFMFVYLVAAVIQVAILLYVATLMIYLVWRFKIDPDNFSIPLLTALGDLLGIGLLTLVFLFLDHIGETTHPMRH